MWIYSVTIVFEWVKDDQNHLQFVHNVKHVFNGNNFVSIGLFSIIF